MIRNQAAGLTGGIRTEAETMLVLSRRVGEEISIGGNIRVMVVRVSGEKVRLGIVAPREVKVLRQELVGREPENDDDKSEAA